MFTATANKAILIAELKDLKSQRAYFVRRVERASDLNRSQRRRDLDLLDKRIADHQRMLDRTKS